MIDYEFRIENEGDLEHLVVGFKAIRQAYMLREIEERELRVRNEISKAFATERPLPYCIQIPRETYDPPGMKRLLVFNPDDMDGVYL